jgi:hypothetical protein
MKAASASPLLYAQNFDSPAATPMATALWKYLWVSALISAYVNNVYNDGSHCICGGVLRQKASRREDNRDLNETTHL